MKYSMLLFLILLFSGISCIKNPVDPNEGELITTVRVKMTETISGVEQVFEFTDPDGEGGNVPVRFDEIILSPNKIYRCELELLNESTSPVTNASEEIANESADHQFYFQSTVDGLVIGDLDLDQAQLPFGLHSTWTTHSLGSGSVVITLKHKPGYKKANDFVAVGDTDLALDFKVSVQ